MKTRFFAFAALALSLAACNNDNENLNDGPVAAQFIADIHKAVSTRVNSEGTGMVRSSISMTPKRRPSMPTIRIRLMAER